DSVTLLPGGTVTYTVVAQIDPSATGLLVNTATVTPPEGVPDLNPDNNSSTDTVPLTPQADLSITKTDGVTTAIPGTTTTYTIVVQSLSGPSDVIGATVSDVFPPSITSATWTSTATGGATGNTASGTGNINDTVNLPIGSSITYIVTVTISSS